MRHLFVPALAALAALCAVPAAAQTAAPADPYANDPTGIVADPCPPHPAPQGADWDAWHRAALLHDFGQLCHFAADNRAVTTRPDVVFMGDSITELWISEDPGFFNAARLDRGISGQTTPQMLVRFRQDVIALHPRAVQIMAGTNDIAGNTGATTLATIEGDIQSMAELARAHGIKVMLASTPPAAAFRWAPDKHPAAQITALNLWLRAYALANGFTYVDYYAALAGPDGGMKEGLASDGVHPTPAGYALMRPIALAAIRKTLRR
jgi:lysophospholipase L1-like esterase